MNTSSPSQHLFNQCLLVMKYALFLLIVYLLGPALLAAIVERNQTKDTPWSATGCGAVVLFAFYVPIWLFYSKLVFLWSLLFLLLAHLIHVPLLASFGETALWPPTFTSLLWRWLMVLPVTGIVALLFRVSPSTVNGEALRQPQEPRRILTPDEVQQLAAARQAEEQQRLLQAQQQQEKPAAEPPPHLAPRNSLWGSVNWNNVPDTHPAKAAALQEMQRTRWLTQQAKDIGITSPAVQALPSSPPTDEKTSIPEDDEDEDEYDWDHGEGIVQDS